MGGCGCGGKRPQGTAASLRRSFSIPEPTNCSGTYSGPNEDRVVYMVAIGTENEQGFAKDQRATAMSLAARNQWTIDPLPARSLCHEVVVAALGE